MGYWIALVIGVIFELMAIGSIIIMARGLGPAGERMGDRGPLGAIIPLVIGAILILIAVIGLRKRKRPKHFVDDTDLDIDEID